MLSVVVYGRNDAHGYNLHKRVALSLNCIAELLSDPNDEIIFVDYNTADELPTCPEAIHDTLTDRTLQKLRILRVRPTFHAVYCEKTHIPVLEPQARNIGIRRTNPQNRWVLSTNTDMIFVPRDDFVSLTSVTESLPNGYYHLPRFELPESLWEALDRSDPTRALESVAEWGRRFHLNEIVYGGFDNLYEAPGDFQLFLREDLFEICGYNEEMILGWHVDSNIARRMKLFRGEVRSAVDRLCGYHCSHTRQSTIYHGSSSSSNSIQTFVVEIEDPICRTQSRSWGAPHLAVEEIRLGSNHRVGFVSALAEAISHEMPALSEASLHPSSYGEVGYDADHVLPHLANLICELPPGQTLFFCGDDHSLITGLWRFLNAAGRAARIILPVVENVPLIDCNAAADGEQYDWLGLDDALEHADLLILQYPSADLLPPVRRHTCEWFCQHVLERVTHIERSRPAVSRRRLIVVNAMHTPLQDTVNECMSFTAMPYITRLRHGFIIDTRQSPHPALPSDPASRRLHKSLGRQFAFSSGDVELLKAALRTVSEDPAEKAGWARLAREVAAIATEPEVALAEFDVSEQSLPVIFRRATEVMHQRLELCAETAIAVGPRPSIGTRICSGADWEDQDWRSIAERYFGGGHSYSIEQRSRWVWERVTLLNDLMSSVSRASRPWVLVVSENPDILALLTAHSGYRVAYATASEWSGKPAADWTAALSSWNVLAPGELLPLHRLQQASTSEMPRFAAVLACAGSLFSRGADHVSALLDALPPLLEPGAYLGATLVVHLNDRTYDGALSFSDWKELSQPQGILGRLGLIPAGPSDHRIPLDTAVRFAQDDSTRPVSGLSFGYGDAFVSIAATAARWPGEPITPALTGKAGANLDHVGINEMLVADRGWQTSLPISARDHLAIGPAHGPNAHRAYRIGFLDDAAEDRVIESLRIAAERMGHELISADSSDAIIGAQVDFVLVAGSAQPKTTENPTFSVINAPCAPLYQDERQLQNLLTYDGYLTIADGIERFATAISAEVGRSSQVGFYAITPERQAVSADIAEIVGLVALRLCYVGDQCEPGAQPFFRALARRRYLRIYGPADCWEFLEDHAYHGEVRAAGERIETLYASFGAGLVVLPPGHLIEDLVSNQLFEVVSVGALAICPDIPWVRKNFGDTVFYYDAFAAPQDIIGQIDIAMAAIEAEPQQAWKRAAEAKAIFDQRFAAEKMIASAAKYFEEWQAGDGRAGETLATSASSSSRISSGFARLCAGKAGLFAEDSPFRPAAAAGPASLAAGEEN